VFKTRLTDMLGIQYPIIQGGLHWLATPELASAVSNAGALGLITAANYKGKDDLKADIRRMRELTDKPFGVNVSIGRKQVAEYVEAVLEEPVPVVTTSGRNPEGYVKRMQEKGTKVIHVVPSVRFAEKAQEVGCDAVVLVGFECGGHPGMDDVTTFVLIPRAVDVLKIPVIAAGGIADARGFVAALALGAEGVQIGTRFVLTQECVGHPAYKQALLKGGETDTLIIERSIRSTGRVLRNPHAENIVKREREGAPTEEIVSMVSGERSWAATREGDVEGGLMYASQAICLMNDIPTVKELVERIIGGAAEVHVRLDGLMGK